MQNKFKITFVFSVVIIVCWLSILTCYAQEKRKDQRPHDEVFIDNMGRKQNESANELKLNSTEIIREEIPDNYEQNSESPYLRSDGEQIDDNYTPAQEKPIIHHKEQEKNKLPASEPNLNEN